MSILSKARRQEPARPDHPQDHLEDECCAPSPEPVKATPAVDSGDECCAMPGHETTNRETSQK